MNAVTQSLAGLPEFLLYFGLGLALFVLFLAIYSAVTVYNEFKLIRDGNLAAAISLAGATLGFVLPLASAIAHSVSPVDMVIWGLVALASQLVVYFVVGRVMPHLAQSISAGRVAPATLLASASIAVGLLNAAAMTY
jgi:putative membrane protein